MEIPSLPEWRVTSSVFGAYCNEKSGKAGREAIEQDPEKRFSLNRRINELLGRAI